jgi:hypothetical protein
VHVHVVLSGDSTALRDVVADADLAIRGVVGPGRSHLSDDQGDVLTDYEILRPTFVQSFAKSADPKAALQSVTVTLQGGSITIDGLTYTSRHLSRPRLEPGTV